MKGSVGSVTRLGVISKLGVSDVKWVCRLITNVGFKCQKVCVLWWKEF